MCGIIGFATNQNINLNSLLIDGLDTMLHRGPDGSGVWFSDDGKVGFGHRRLAIIDLTASGKQPMLDNSSNIIITFNGEIYNYIELKNNLIKKGHTFKTKSDTEVILNAYKEWGYNCLNHLNGMFAFAIYDLNNKKIFIARDRVGEKPLFYSIQNNIFRFASELKALMSDKEFKREVDHESLDCYFSMGFIPGDKCILKGVNKLPPAHALEFSIDTFTFNLWKYWNLPDYINHEEVEQEKKLLDELDFLLEDSVNKQLIADVPVGVLLSGGVDSSLVTAMAVRSNKNVKTFTIRFPGHKQYDETEHARMISKHFKTEHIELEGLESNIDLLPILARQFDEPIIDSSMIPTFLVSKLIRQHCTVAIGGDGGDELFGGYGHYDRLLWLGQNFKNIPKFFKTPIASIAENILPIGFKGRNWLQNFAAELKYDLPLIASYFDKTSRNKLISNNQNWPFVAEIIRKDRVPKNSDLLQRATRMDFLNYLPEDILVKVDRASMLNSLEVRAPFLDYRLIEFAYSKVPTNQKTTTSEKKILLKKLCTRILPPNFDQNRKQGFSIPLNEWLKSPKWSNYFKEILLDTSSDNFLNKNFIESLFEGQRIGRSNSERLFSLVMFELWRKTYGIKI